VNAPATIGFDATPLLGDRSGVGNYTGQLLAALIQGFPEWKYLLYSNRSLGQLESSLSKAIQVKSYPSLTRWIWMQAMVPALITRSQPDLCHYTNALAPVRQARPFVLSIHDASLFLYRQHHPRTRLLTVRLLLPLTTRRAAAIITMSYSARDDLARVLGILPEKIHVIYESRPKNVSPVNDPGHLASVRRRHKLPEQFILYVGTLEPRKNLRRLVRAFHRLRQQGYPHKLVFAGSWGWSMNGFAQEIEELGLSSLVHFLGYVPASDLPAIYSMATVFAFPSLYEGFGLPPLEAMACGTPVLSSNNSSLAELYAGAAQLIDPLDEEELTRGLRQILNDPEWRSELSRRGMKRARRFSWERAALETTAVYEQVLSQNSVARAPTPRLPRQTG
jgi:glycosyltransferase involved in cell wall biosynthesis